jgi:hypothetical protein
MDNQYVDHYSSVAVCSTPFTGNTVCNDVSIMEHPGHNTKNRYSAKNGNSASQ